MALVWTFSGEGFSNSSTSRFIGPLLAWLFPNLGEAARNHLHFAIRKSGHAAEYCVLALLGYRALRLSFALSVRRLRLTVLSLVLAVAVADEGHQSEIETRSGSPWDVALDLTGAGLALALLSALQGRGRR